jgi:hypothetical protein
LVSLSLLESFRVLIAEGRVASLAMVAQLDILEDLEASFGSGVEHAGGAFALEG